MGRRDENLLDRLLDAMDLDVDREDLAVDRATLRLLIKLGREVRQLEDILVADLNAINAALEELAAEITTLGEQVAALQAGSVTQEQLDQIAAGITAAADSVDAIITDDDAETPAEETPEEPPTEEGPPTATQLPA